VKRVKERDGEVHALDIGTGVRSSISLEPDTRDAMPCPKPSRIQYGRMGWLACSSLSGPLPGVCVLRPHAGSGLLAVLAARAGADSVVACDLHEPLAAAARRVSCVSCSACRSLRLIRIQLNLAGSWAFLQSPTFGTPTTIPLLALPRANAARKQPLTVHSAVFASHPPMPMLTTAAIITTAYSKQAGRLNYVENRMPEQSPCQTDFSQGTLTVA
jgi:hypothetical protein